jgi:epoxide hydrolase
MSAVVRNKASEIEPLRLSVPETTLARLRQRLSHDLRSGEALSVCLAYGASWDALRDLVHRLQAGFALERQRLFDLPCFEARLGDERMCFIHARSDQRSALPLLLLHGSCGSLAEFQDQIQPLTEGANGRPHHVVTPSLPGFGLTRSGLSARAAAELCAELMDRLGYARYVVHGSELGAKIALELAALDGAHVAAAHVTGAPAYPAAGTQAELSAHEKSQLLRLSELQSELDAGLPQSPLEELAYALSRVDDELGPPSRSLGDGLLTALALSATFTTPRARSRLCAELLEPAPSSAVPVALNAFPLGAPSLRRAAAERYRIAEWREHERGGSMPALEQPELWRESLARSAAQLD